jgi:hypothetical protein
MNNNNDNDNDNDNNTFDNMGSAHVMMLEIVRDYFANPNDYFKFFRDANARIDAFINQNIGFYPTKALQDQFRQHTLLEAQNTVSRILNSDEAPMRQERHHITHQEPVPTPAMENPPPTNPALLLLFIV